MFRIRRIYDDVLPVNRRAIEEVRRIFASQFPAAPHEDIDALTAKLRNPFKQRFRTTLFVAENARGHVVGFAIVLHEPVLGFSYLDFIAAAPKTSGRGVGAALYEHVRDEAVTFGMRGLFFECLPDDADRCADPAVRKQNAARLKFYEQYGARPIIKTAYETAVPGGSSDNLPHMMFDGLGRMDHPPAAHLRKVIRAVLERKYSALCPPDYVEHVVRSIREPVIIREPRYQKHATVKEAQTRPPELVAMTINDKHDIHHVRERGYVESPVRIKAIETELKKSGLVDVVPVREYPLKHITAVHDSDFVHYLQRSCALAASGESVYPYVFPIRNAARPPKDLSVRAGYYCIDTFTPINRNAFPAAKRAVDCALTAADAIVQGRRFAYALVRPPGHHAERRAFGGFCYFNNAAVAAHYLSALGKVAILDLDYHHGNGQQNIFYERPDVLTISIHGHPELAYPYFSGFADERGKGHGEGFNINFPLPEARDGEQYRSTLARAIRAIANFGPMFLVVALGLDPAKGDPTGTWSLKAKDFEENGRMIRALDLPTLVVQEGGYRTRTLGVNARHFFTGLVLTKPGKRASPRALG